MLCSYRKCQKIEVWMRLGQGMTKKLLRQSLTKHLGKKEKSSNIQQDKKSLASTFACFLTAIAKV